MFSKIKMFFLLRKVDISELDFLVKFLAVCIYAGNREIDKLEIVMAKEIIENYIEEKYKNLSEKEKRKIFDYFSDRFLKELRKIMQNNDYYKCIETECFICLKEKEQKERIYFIDKMFNIFWMKGNITEEEKKFFEKFEKFKNNI